MQAHVCLSAASSVSANVARCWWHMVYRNGSRIRLKYSSATSVDRREAYQHPATVHGREQPVPTAVIIYGIFPQCQVYNESPPHCRMRGVYLGSDQGYSSLFILLFINNYSHCMYGQPTVHLIRAFHCFSNGRLDFCKLVLLNSDEQFWNPKSVMLLFPRVWITLSLRREGT